MTLVNNHKNKILKLFFLDKDGVITTQELQAAVGVLKEKLSDEEIKVIITKVDKDHDGKILKQDLHEFIDGLQQQPDQPKS